MEAQETTAMDLDIPDQLSSPNLNASAPSSPSFINNSSRKRSALSTDISTSDPASDATSGAASDPTSVAASDPSSLPTLCLICNSEAQTTCPDCKQVNYCSSACLALDNDTHSHLCNYDLPASQKNPTCHSLAFHFPPDSTDVRLIWLKTVLDSEDSDDVDKKCLSELWNINVDALKERNLRSLIVGQNVHRLRNLRGEFAILTLEQGARWISREEDSNVISSSDSADLDTEVVHGRVTRDNRGGRSDGIKMRLILEENLAVTKLLGDKYSRPSEWKGPVLVMALQPRDSAAKKNDMFKLRDVTVSDLTDVADILGCCKPGDRIKREKLCVDVWKLPPGRRIQGHRVRCARDSRRRNNALGEEIFLSNTQLAAMEARCPGESLVFGNMIKLPLKMYPLSSAIRRAGPRGHRCHDKDMICNTLRLVGLLRWHGMNPNKVNLGFHNKDCVGEALFFRADGMHLTNPQFKAIRGLAKEIADMLEDAFENSTGTGQLNEIGNKALSLADKGGYQEFFSALQDRRVGTAGQEEWEEATPY